MVQRKAPKKLVESQRHQHLPTDQQNNTRSKGEGGGGDQSMNLVKKKKKRPNKFVDGSGSALRPNYMNPTSSSDARKERLKVTLTTTTNSSTASDRNHSKPSIKILNRKPSLRRARSLKVVNRETCSSTLKDSKFPEALELGPGGTEAEGTSAMRVCPYNYCSLNGHWHEPLPPLKSFMSARRKVVQAQKSFKLKGLSSVKLKGSGKDDKRIDTGQTSIISRTSSGLPLIPLIEEIANDFFVEIYAKPNELDIKLDHDFDAINTQKEDVTDDELDNKDEMTLGEDVNQESDLSVEQMDDLMNVMEYIDCYQQIQVQEEKQSSSVPEEDYAEWCAECYIFQVLNKGSQVICESKTPMSTSDHSDYPGDDVLGPISLPLLEEESTVAEFSLEPSSNVCEIAEVDAEKLLEDCENSDGDSQSDDERIGADVPFCCNTKTPYTPEILVQDQPTVTPESTQGNEQDVESTIEAEDSLSIRHDESDSTFLNFEDKVSEEREGHERAKVCDEASELANLERKQNFDDQSLDHPIISHGNKEQENMDDEVGELSSLLIFQISEPCQGSAERNTDMTEGDHIQTEQEAEECKWDESLKDPTITPEMHNPSIDFRLDESNKGKNLDNSAKEEEERNDLEGSIIRNTKHDCLEINEVTETEGGITEDKAINATANSYQPLSEAADKPKARKRTIRTRATEAPQKMKDFNPRSPRFLEVEPDSEPEKVDLRHQMMDERKNAEEWLIDYALQQTVSKLDPARKKKVALLVKAFETVMPLPICEEPRRYATSGFAHARPTQACN